MNTNNQSTLMENLSLAAATLMLGVMAGFFWTYSFNVNYALALLDQDTYALVQSLLNQNVRHPMFFIFFFGSALTTAIALLINARHWRTLSFWFTVLALIIYIAGVILYTKVVNLPLNSYTESWVAGSVPNDWAEIRDQWNHANLIRVLTSAAAFCLCLLTLIMRATYKPQPEDNHHPA